jgi:hypothetical protein
VSKAASKCGYLELAGIYNFYHFVPLQELQAEQLEEGFRLANYMFLGDSSVI